MVEINPNLLNRPVRVKKSDGYVKSGILLQVEDSYIVLKYFDSRECVVLRSEIEDVVPYEEGSR